MIPLSFWHRSEQTNKQKRNVLRDDARKFKSQISIKCFFLSEFYNYLELECTKCRSCLKNELNENKNKKLISIFDVSQLKICLISSVHCHKM